MLLICDCGQTSEWREHLPDEVFGYLCGPCYKKHRRNGHQPPNDNCRVCCERAEASNANIPLETG